MQTNDFGKRFEKLLFLSIPITLAAFFVLLVSSSSNLKIENSPLNCFQDFAVALTKNAAEIDESWKFSQPITQSKYWGGDYKYELTKALISIKNYSFCYDLLNSVLQQQFKRSPKDFLEMISKKIEELQKSPHNFAGFEIPKIIKLNFFSAEFKINVSDFTKIIQILLAPIFLLWLGSLYNTRYREIIEIEKIENLSKVFPHALNLFHVSYFKINRSKYKTLLYFPNFVFFVYATTRVIFLALFVLPSVFSYLYSFELSFGAAYAYFLFASWLVLVPTLACFSLEFHWTIFKKTFFHHKS